MKLSRERRALLPDAYPGQINWDYDRAEIIADGAVHAIGVCLGLIGAVTIVVIAAKVEGIKITPILVYIIGLVTMLALSAAYNMWPVSPAKWVLRRFDHSAIYLLIAGTYTPFLAQMKSALASAGLGVGVWLSAAVGIALKLALPGRFDRLAVVLCLLLGWSGVIAYDSFASALPSASLWLLAIGGILYSVGALFHVWQGLRFHNDLARFRADRRKLPLFGGPRLLVLGISGGTLGKRSAESNPRRCPATGSCNGVLQRGPATGRNRNFTKLSAREPPILNLRSGLQPTPLLANLQF